MSEMKKVQNHFDKTAVEFDQLYHQQGNVFHQFNKWLRKPLYRRFELTLDECGDVDGKQILDVGCGSGRYSVALARKGARVTGIDFASEMLTIAEDLAQENEVASYCHFINGDFLERDFLQSFSISLAIGFFDYIAHPRPFLRKLREITTDKVIITFPRPGNIRSTQRKIRYQLMGCPLYFYTQEDFATYLSSSGFRDWYFVGSWVVAYP